MASDESNDGFSSLAEYGVSEELKGVFECLREAEGMAGVKYRSDDIAKLSTAIVFRNYGKACLELGYLLAGIISLPAKSRGSGSALLDFFWLEEAISPKRVRAHLATRPSGGAMTLEGDLIAISLGSTRFTISPTRVGFLAALLEFIVHIDPNCLGPTEESLASLTDKSVKAFSSNTQKKIFAYLGEHLNPAQQFRRVRLVFNWCKEHKADGETVMEFATDRAVKMFWQEFAGNDDINLGFRRFKTVGENFLILRRAISLGDVAVALHSTATIGADTEGGEIHPDHLSAALEQDDSATLDLSSVAETPRFLTGGQVKMSASLTSAGKEALELPLTVFRLDIFGGWQSRLSQAEKDRDGERLANYLNDPPADASAQYRQTLAQLREAITKALTLGLGVYLAAGSDESFGLLKELLPSDDLAEMGEHLKRQTSYEQAHSLEIADLAELRLALPALNKLCRQAEDQFKNSTREGFKSLPEDNDLSAYVYATETMIAYLQRLDRYIQVFDQHLNKALTTDPLSDEDFFQRMLTTLYGGKL